jgi:hypothetical protein
MRNMGRLTPTLFLIGSSGLLVYMPKSLPDERDKDEFATDARLICIAHAATAAVMALEAWVKYAKPGETLDETERPSEAFDRQEVVVLMGESHQCQQQKFLPIIRSGNGKFFGFGEADSPPTEKLRGRFSQLLPSNVPDAATCNLAKALLKSKGIGLVKPGTTTRLSRSRR